MSVRAPRQDEVVFGRDQDNSQDAVKDVRQGVAFQGAYGSTSKQVTALLWALCPPSISSLR